MAENPAPEGFVWQWVPAPDRWRLIPEERQPRFCRFGSAATGFCRAPAVAELDRGHSRGGSYWWAYCEEHLYGRRIMNGRIEQENLVPSVSSEGDEA